MMEGLRGFDAMRRSRDLVRRSLKTTVAAVLIMFLVPLIGSAVIAFTANAAAKSISGTADKIQVIREEANENEGAKSDADSNDVPFGKENEGGFKVKVNGDDVSISEPIEGKNMGESIKETIREALTQILLLPFQILALSFSSIVFALLYMKTRQVGGESMQDLLEQFEESDQPRTNWQKRVKARLEQSGRQTSRNT